jgi:Zn-dependent protease with chaperone function
MPADSLSTVLAFLFLGLSWCATYFVHSTCLIAGVWLFLRRRRTAGHALRETLWKTALVGGVVTASVQMWLAPVSPFGNLTLKLEGIRLPIAAAMLAPDANSTTSIDGLDALHQPALIRYAGDGESYTPTDLSAVDSAREFGEFSLDSQTEAAVILPLSDGSHLASDQLPAGAGNRWTFTQRIGRVAAALPPTYALLFAMALLAIVLGIARCGWQTISLRRKLAHCQLIVGGPARELLDELLRVVPQSPQVRLLLARGDSEPAAFGISRWTIVLPPRAAFDLTEDELRALLAHELAHLVRGDSLWLYISRAVCSCLAFQPLNHLARREWQRTAEFLCDNWAVSRTGAPLALARCLTEVASWRLAGPASAAILAATGRKSGLVDRIERLLDARPVFEFRNDLRDRRRTVFAGAFVLAVLVCCAPRVQLVAAAPRENEKRVDDSLRLAEFAVRASENEIGEVQAADVAKPPASGDRQLRKDQRQDEAVSAPSTNAAQRGPGDVASLLESLDGEMTALASELEQIRPLLEDNAVPQAVSLAKRLRGDIGRLQHRREVLKALSRNSVK